MKHLAALAALLVLSACGGGGGGGSAGPADAAVAKQIPPVVITTYGNSLDYGYSPPLIFPPNPIAEAELRALTGRQDITIQTDARPSTTAAQMLLGTDGSGLPWAERLARDPATIVDITHGTNEADAESLRAALEQLVAGARAAHKAVLLETPPPIDETGTDPRTRDMTAANHALKVITIRNVGAKLGVPVCDVYQAFMDAHRTGPADLLDGTHLSTDAAAFRARVRAHCLLPLVQ